MNDETVMKVVWGIVISAVSAFLSAVLGIKFTQIKMSSKQQALEKSMEDMEKVLIDKMDHFEVMMKSNNTTMGREISELKEEVKTMRHDMYQPKFNKN